MDKLLKKFNPYLVTPRSAERSKINERLGEVIPPFEPEMPFVAKMKQTGRTVLLYFLVLILGLGIFLGYRVVKDFDTVWHYLKNDQTIAFTLTNQKTVQDTKIDDILDQLTKPDQTLQQKLVKLAVSGYSQKGWNPKGVVVYDGKLRSKYQLTFEQRIQTAIDVAYHIYNNFDIDTEREVYGITTDELVYQQNLKVYGYPPLALKHSVFEGRRYFPFALIAGQVAGIDPLRLLKIFEIETDFNESTIGRNNDEEINNDDIGIAQNNLAVLPGLIRDILNPESPAYCPFFEFLSLGADLETGKTLTWSDYLIRLEGELNGTYNHQKNPTGQYYINRLKAPHIGAFLAAYHIKRDETYGFDVCKAFYRQKAQALKQALKLPRNLDADHWTDYTFYNGGPKRWFVMREYLTRYETNQTIPPALDAAVKITRRRNLAVQRIGEKNEYLRNRTYDPTRGEIVPNDSLHLYGLYDFAPNYQPRDWLYNLNLEVARKDNSEALVQTQ